jgi:hypothetical protein
MLILNNKKKAYENEIKRLKEKIAKLQEAIGDPKYVLQKLLKNNIDSYDWTEIQDKVIRKEYAQTAKQLLKNEVLQNEINGLYGDLVKEIAMNSENFEIVRDLRMTISGAKLIMERIEAIGESKEPTKDDLHKQI